MATNQGRSSRRRGATYERALVDYLREAGFTGAERTAGGMYAAQPNGDISGLPGVYLEARNRARLELAAWVDEVTEAAGPAIPLLVIKRRGVGDRGKDYAVLPLARALQLLDETP